MGASKNRGTLLPKIGVPYNGWFILENHIKMDDFGGTTIFGNPRIFCGSPIPSFCPSCPSRPSFHDSNP